VKGRIKGGEEEAVKNGELEIVIKDLYLDRSSIDPGSIRDWWTSAEPAKDSRARYFITFRLPFLGILRLFKLTDALLALILEL
jgi:hypothetical protein